ncbi:MAG: YihY/virulence factor BrkB family protein [Bacteroidota bacterium]|nr:YihY/virulence factor BrkB family protein [Bacteroidota bacterium]
MEEGKITWSGIWEILKNAATGFSKNKVTKLSASLAYYTIFSLAPLLVVIIYLAGLFWSQNAIEGNLVRQLQGLIGSTSASQIQSIIKNASVNNSSSTFTAIIGFAVLLIGATTVFTEMQSSLNYIWNLRLKKNTGIFELVLSRILSFAIVVSLSFLLLASLIINTLLEGLIGKIQQMFPGIAFQLIYLINLIITFLVTTLLLGIIYKVLPNAEIQWKDVAAGAVFTAVLFMLSKFGITLYVRKSNLGSSYGAAGSILVLFSWIYFSSMILYFGAEVTKAYSMKYGGQIRPTKYTVTIQTIEVESKKNSVQENELDAENTKKETQAKKDKESSNISLNI